MDRKKKSEISVVPQMIYRSLTNLSQNSRRIFFVEIDKLIPKFIWKCKGHKMTKISLKKNTDEQLTLPDLL